MEQHHNGEPESRDYYTTAQAAHALGVSIATISRWVAAGVLPAYRVGPRSVRIKKGDLSSVIRPARGSAQSTMRVDIVSAPPSAEELARRQAVVQLILERSQERSIAPATSAELVRRARREEVRSYGLSRRGGPGG